MIATSAEYKAQVEAPVTEWGITVKIDYSDYNIDNDIEAYQNDSDRTSDNAQMSDGIEFPTYQWMDWASFEWGQHLRSESVTENEKGGWTAKTSDPNTGDYPVFSGGFFGSSFAGSAYAAKFNDCPRFIVSFLPRDVSELKVVFDSKLGQWAEDFDIEVYSADGLEYSESVTGNSSFKYETNITTVRLAQNVEVIVKKWSLPGAKAKVIEMFTSVSETYDTDDIEGISILEEAQADNTESPIGNFTANQMTGTLLNWNNRFDVDNENSPLFGKVIKNRRVSPFFQLGSLADSLPGGVFYTTDWEVKENELTASFNAQDLASLMGQSEYDQNSFITPGSDHTFTYTTTADFDLWTKENVLSLSDQLIFQGSSLQCGSGEQATTFYGHAFAGSAFSTNKLYCGTADRIISFNYVPGCSVKLSFSANDKRPAGTNVRYFVSDDDGVTFSEIMNGGYIFTPTDITDTTQEITFRVLFESQSLTANPSVQDIEVTIAESVTLYSLATLVIEDFDNETNLVQGNYTIDQLLGEIEIDNAFFAPKTHRAAIKAICEAGGANAYIGRDGGINIEVLQGVDSIVKYYTEDNYAKKVNRSNDQELYNRVTVLTNPLEKAATTSEIAKVKVEILDGDTQEVTVKYTTVPSEYNNLDALPSGVTVTSGEYFTWGARLTLSNASGSDQDFDLVLNGYPYSVTGQRRIQIDNTENIRRNGVIELVIDNELIQSESQAQFVAEQLIDSFGTQKRAIDIQVVPDPSMVVGDSISVDDRSFRIRKNELQYKRGTISQKIGGRR